MSHRVSRREFLQRSTGAAVAAGAAIAGLPALADGQYGSFRVGLQSYTLRAFDFDAALEMTRKLDVHYWESFQAHIPANISVNQRLAILAKLKAANVKLTSWGVQSFDGNFAKCQQTFDFAKSLKLETISADPSPDSFAHLDKLVAKYKINIAIHNHGPGARYDKLAGVLRAVRGHHPRLGVCVDTGHVLRSGEDPVDWIKALGPRVLDVHLKDVSGKTKFTEVGQGDLRTIDVFKELKKNNYRGVVQLEYEEHEKDPGSYIDICLSATQDAIRRAAAGL